MKGLRESEQNGRLLHYTKVWNKSGIKSKIAVSPFTVRFGVCYDLFQPNLSCVPNDPSTEPTRENDHGVKIKLSGA
jgi:hypothetical protein